MESRPLFSIIIPVYNGEKVLERCIRACLNQQGLSNQQQQVEIIIIDNNSTDSTSKIITNLCKTYSNIRAGFERRRSSYAARNRGIDLARGKYIVFTDADCIPSPRWLYEYLRGIELLTTRHRASSPWWHRRQRQQKQQEQKQRGEEEERNRTHQKPFLIAGGIELIPLLNDTTPVGSGDDNNAEVDDKYNIYALYDKINHLNQRLFTTDKEFGATANLLVHSAVFKAVGKFNPKLISGGDSEFCRRAVATRKYKIYYWEHAKVYHPARTTLNELIAKNYRIGFGFGQQYYIKHGERMPIKLILRYLFPNVGYLRPEYFPQFLPESSYQIPKNNNIRLKLLILDSIVRCAQTVGRLKSKV